MALNRWQKEKLAKLSKEQLLDFIDLIQRTWWNLQNNWMLYMNNEYGQEAAEVADSHCFSASAKVQMYRLREMFDLTDDLQSLMDAMILSTIWANGDYEIWKIDERSFRIKVTNCYQQERRVRDGMGELGCKSPGLTICKAASKVINPAADVKCIVCPPDEHPEGVWCEWEFQV